MPVFGNFGLVRANLDRTANDTNGIESYSLYWILALIDYVLNSGDTDALRVYAGTVCEKLLHSVEVVRHRGKLGFCGHDDRTGSAFKEPEIEANHRFHHLLALRTVRTFQTALTWTGDDDASVEVCRAVETALLEVPLPTSEVLGLHDGTEAVLAGALTDSLSEFIDREYRNEVTSVSYSPFNTYFVLQGMVHAGCVAEAMGLVRRCWGGMISLGATTFWEVFRPEWVDLMKPCDPPPDGVHGYTSLCHPWSAGVTRWLSDHVLGVRPTTPGYSEFVFDPLAAGLKKMSGTVATVNGAIRAGFEGRSAWLEVPAECHGSVKTNAGVRRFGPGRHEFELEEEEPSPVVTPARSFAAAWEPDSTLEVGLVRSTAWMAFAATPDGGDLVHLPHGTSITISEKCLAARCSVNTMEITASRASPRSGKTIRRPRNTFAVHYVQVSPRCSSKALRSMLNVPRKTPIRSASFVRTFSVTALYRLWTSSISKQRSSLSQQNSCGNLREGSCSGYV